MTVSEKLAYVHAPDGAYIIRARPSDATDKVYPANGAPVLALIEVLRDAIWRGRPWTVAVRRAEDDPYGPTVLEEELLSRRQAVAAIKLLKRELPNV